MKWYLILKTCTLISGETSLPHLHDGHKLAGEFFVPYAREREALVAPPLILLIITMITILSISLKAALASPINALRQE